MAECSMCGEMIYVALAYAWTARSVARCECGKRIPVGADVFFNLKAQAAVAVSEIDRRLSAP